MESRQYSSPEPRPQGTQEQKVNADDLRFMLAVMEKSYQHIKPKTSNSVMWGLICMAIYVGSYFLVKNQLFNWLRPLQISLISVGVICTIIQAHFLLKQFRQQGFVPQLLLTSVLYGLPIIVLPVFIFDLLGLFKGMYCGPAFIYAFMVNTVMVLVGVIHSKLWFTGTIFIIAGILLAFLVREYSLLILGIANGIGIIFSALVVDLNYRRMEKENA
jgi:hypothetical protein